MNIEVSDEVYKRLLEDFKDEKVSWDFVLICLMDGWNELGILGQYVVANEVNGKLREL